MKISRRDAKILVALAGLLVFVACYFIFYQNCKAKNDQVSAENAALQQKVANLETLDAKKEEYVAETKKMNDEIKKVADTFPALIQEENDIINTSKLEQETGIAVSTLTMGVPLSIQNTAETTGGATYSLGYAIYDVKLNLVCSADYNQLKNAVKAVNGSSNYTTVSSLAVTFDSSNGMLSGNMDVDAYYMTGTGKKYDKAVIPGMNMGTDNIFGTITK